MGYRKKDVTPLLMHWSYVFFALTHRYTAVSLFRVRSWNNDIISSLHAELFKKIWITYEFSMNSWQWDHTCTQNCASWKIIPFWSFTFSAMAANGLALEGARASTAMLLPTSLGKYPSLSTRRVNSSPPGQNGRHFGRWQFQMHFENDRTLIRISLKFVPRGPFDNKPALV